MSKSASGKANSGNGSNNKRKYRDADWLRKQYVIKGKSAKAIADEYGYGNTTINEWLDKHGIEKRSLSEAVAKAKKPDGLYTDEDWLRNEYIEKKKTKKQVSDECDASKRTVAKWLKKHDIEKPRGWDKRKSGPWDSKEWLYIEYVENKKTVRNIASENNVSATLIRTRLNEYNIPRRNRGDKGVEWHKNKKHTDSDWLQTEYIEKKRSGYELADECDVAPSTIYTWLDRYDINRRHPRFLTGEEHPSWKGGGGGIEYGSGWTESKKTAVRDRDNFTCQDPNCSVTQEEYIEKHGLKLDVHHLKKAEDVENPEERNDIENLITLCRKCHKRWEKIADAGLVPQMNLDTQNTEYS